VDDDSAFREMMVDHLRGKGFQVESAQDGLEAFEMLRLSGPFYVMVTDLVMPGLSGLELLRRAKKLDSLLEVIVITAVGSIELAISALREDGAYDYLSKPFEIIGELSLAVERAATHRQIRLERDTLKGSLVHRTRRLKEILSCTGIPIIAGNEKDELTLVSPAASHLGIQKRDADLIKKDVLPQYIYTILKRWRSMGGQLVAWVETKGIDGEEIQVKMIPLNIEDSLGWVMVLQNIMYQKRLENFLFRSYVNSMEETNRSMEKASILRKGFKGKKSVERGDHSEARMQKDLAIDEVEEDTIGLLTLVNRPTEPSGRDHSTPLHQVLEKYQSAYQGLEQQETETNIVWEIAEDLPFLRVDPSLMSQLLHHLVQLAKLLHTDQLEKKINICTAQGEVWMSIPELGLNSYAKDLMSLIEWDSEFDSESSNHAQMELIIVKFIAEQMGYQVWIEHTEKGDLSLSICLSE